MARTGTAPHIDGLVASRVLRSTWLGKPGTTWDYHHPADCRPNARRISVLLLEPGPKDVRLIEGDGRSPDFRRIRSIRLADDAGIAEAVDACLVLARELGPPEVTPPADEAVVSGIMLAAGFRLDDFEGSQAWIRDSEIEGFTWYVRGAGVTHEVPLGANTATVSVPGDLGFEGEGEVEIGLVDDDDVGSRTTCVAPGLDEAVRIFEERLLATPGTGEHLALDFATLRGGGPSRGR